MVKTHSNPTFVAPHKQAESLINMEYSSSQNSRKTRLDRLKKRRRIWLKVHLYLGLSAGAILVIIGLTGSLLAFWQPLEAWLNPQWLRVEVPATGENGRLSLSEIVAAADAAAPPGAHRHEAYFPSVPERAFWFFYTGPEIAPGKADMLNVFVDPYTGRVTGTRVWYHADNPLKHCFMGFVFKLHYALLAGTTGEVIVGILGIILTVSVLTGLIVWWPLTGKWYRALTIKPRASVERFNHDLHQTFGIYSTPVLLALFISGIYFSLPDPFIWLVKRFSPVSLPRDFMSDPAAGRTPISPDEALARVLRICPDEQPYWFSVPDTERGIYLFTLNQPVAGWFSGRHQLALDQYSGEILGDLSPSSGRAGQILVQWQWSLHSGHALNTPGQILISFVGLACPVLFATGFIRWRQKCQVKKSLIRN
jgi:uncharacterized iron-regulated membrane protein